MVRVVECQKCGECQRFDTWPDDDSDDILDQLIRAEEWTFNGLDELCPECSETTDREEP
jgi:hypothetical protein